MQTGIFTAKIRHSSSLSASLNNPYYISLQGWCRSAGRFFANWTDSVRLELAQQASVSVVLRLDSKYSAAFPVLIPGG
jgi:hypothetical protein